MRFRFVIPEIGKGFRRNFEMISSIILVTFVSMLAVGSAVLIQMQVNKLKGDWYNKVEVSIWMCAADATESANCQKGAATDDEVNSIKDTLNEPDLKKYIKSVVLQSKEDVFSEFQKSQNNADEWKGITVDSFGPIFRIKLNNPDDYKIIQEMVLSKPGVYDVVDQSKLFEPLFNILNKLQVASLSGASVLGVAAILLISTTIRLSALSRRKETSIMRLVGASNFFIQIPFILEGVIASAFGSILALGALWGLLKFYLVDWIQNSFSIFGNTVTTSDIFVVAPWVISISIILAIISSTISLRRFIKV
jgi:cell division transport system permease protein